MGSTVKKLSSTLTLGDKVYIAENSDKSAEVLSKKLKKGVRSIQNYLNKIKPKLESQEPIKPQKKLTHQDGVATVMSQDAASMPIKLNNRKSPFKYE